MAAAGLSSDAMWATLRVMGCMAAGFLALERSLNAVHPGRKTRPYELGKSKDSMPPQTDKQGDEVEPEPKCCKCCSCCDCLLRILCADGSKKKKNKDGNSKVAPAGGGGGGGGGGDSGGGPAPEELI